MNVGIFAVITLVSSYDEKRPLIDDYRGLIYRSPLLGCLLIFFLVSLVGIPFTGGFFGKFYSFAAAVDGGAVALAIIGLLTWVWWLPTICAWRSQLRNAQMEARRKLQFRSQGWERRCLLRWQWPWPPRLSSELFPTKCCALPKPERTRCRPLSNPTFTECRSSDCEPGSIGHRLPDHSQGRRDYRS